MSYYKIFRKAHNAVEGLSQTISHATYIHSHRPKARLHPRDPKPGGPVLFMGKRKVVAVATPSSDNLLAPSELADIWSTEVTTSTSSSPNAAPHDGADIKQGSHTSSLRSSLKKNKKKHKVSRVKNQHKGFYCYMPPCPLQEVCELKT